MGAQASGGCPGRRWRLPAGPHRAEGPWRSLGTGQGWKPPPCRGDAGAPGSGSVPFKARLTCGRSRSPGSGDGEGGSSGCLRRGPPPPRHVRLRRLHPRPQGEAPDQPELQGRREHGRDRALHGPAAAEGGGGSPGAAADPRQSPLPLDQARQPVPGGRHQEERQRLPGLRLPLQGGGGLLRVLQGAGGGEHPGQLRHRLRAAGRADGLRLPADHGQQDPAGVHHPGGQQAGHGEVARPHHRHQRRVLAVRRHQVQEERGLHRRHRVREPAGRAGVGGGGGRLRRPRGLWGPGAGDGAAAAPQVSANGSVLLSEVVGTIKLKVFLSGMPELRLGLNDRVLFELTGRGKNKSVELEDVKFHQCVRLSRFDNDRTISFVPPDGDFELMSYRLNTQVKPLIWIESVIEKFSHSRVEIMVKAKGQFKKQSVANGVEIAVPVPSDADSPKFKTSVGSAKYLPEKNVVIWTIKSFPGGKEHLMRAHFGLPSVEK
uniref:Adaptor related protein complex 1 subunit mu 2 n=1 Tax=Apteryx owenii TaxID=8824 RepID=A0A8B9SEN8_APTOW